MVAPTLLATSVKKRRMGNSEQNLGDYRRQTPKARDQRCALEIDTSWPNDADGDVLRRLEADGFDFGKSHYVDFNIDFKDWPAPQEAIALLESTYPPIEIVEPDEENLEEGIAKGYILIQISGRMSYEFVVNTQEKLTALMKPFGGFCESWGVMQE